MAMQHHYNLMGKVKGKLFIAFMQTHYPNAKIEMTISVESCRIVGSKRTIELAHCWEAS